MQFYDTSIIKFSVHEIKVENINTYTCMYTLKTQDKYVHYACKTGKSPILQTRNPTETEAFQSLFSLHIWCRTKYIARSYNSLRKLKMYIKLI